MSQHSAASAYRSVRRAGLAEGTTPHSLIALLYTGAIENLTIVSNAENNNKQIRRHYLNKSIAIVQELQASLHNPDSSEISGNLFRLYSFIIHQLMLSTRDDPDADVEACVGILDSLRLTWNEITPPNSPA